MINMSLIYLMVLNLGLGFIGAWFIARYGQLLKLLDLPNVRSSHLQPIPKGGGIGILAAFFLSCWELDLPVSLWLTVGALSLMGLLSDMREMSPKWRLIAQFCIAFLFLADSSTLQNFSSTTTSRVFIAFV